MRFEWDKRKAASNRKKHGLSFDQAEELFRSGNDYLEIFDEANSAEEERFLSIGPIEPGVIAVAWTERSEDVVRIISARFATKKEVTLYRRYMEGTA